MSDEARIEYLIAGGVVTLVRELPTDEGYRVAFREDGSIVCELTTPVAWFPEHEMSEYAPGQHPFLSFDGEYVRLTADNGKWDVAADWTSVHPPLRSWYDSAGAARRPLARLARHATPFRAALPRQRRKHPASEESGVLRFSASFPPSRMGAVSSV